MNPTKKEEYPAFTPLQIQIKKNLCLKEWNRFIKASPSLVVRRSFCRYYRNLREEKKNTGTRLGKLFYLANICKNLKGKKK